VVFRLSRVIVVDAGDLRYPLLLLSKGRLALTSSELSMTDDGKSSVTSPVLTWRRVVLVALWALALTFGQLSSAAAAAQVTLQVGASQGLPGLHHSALSRFLAAHMADAGLADWRFEAAAGSGPAADRVEWSFKLNPYAGGGARRFGPPSMNEWRAAVHRPVTIEARLYLNGDYQALVEAQALVQGGPDDPDLAAAVTAVTKDLLGPKGAFRAIESAHLPAQGSR
jgi:hypothetical protein